MATNKRTYPNTYFSWYNDDDRLAILSQDTTTTSGESIDEELIEKINQRRIKDC